MWIIEPQTGQPLVMGILMYGNDVGDGTPVSTGAWLPVLRGIILSIFCTSQTSSWPESGAEGLQAISLAQHLQRST